MHPPLPDRTFDVNWAKLKALVHYVCHRVPNPKRWGATKLNKALFYSDMRAYLHLGEPITGERYVKQQFGPVPAHIQEVLAELQQERALAIAEATGFYVGQRYPQRLFYPLTQPDISAFSGDEISIVDEVVDVIYHRYTARSISAVSHDVVWESAEIGEEIPYYTVYAHLLGEITAEDVAWARAAIRDR